MGIVESLGSMVRTSVVLVVPSRDIGQVTRVRVSPSLLLVPMGVAVCRSLWVSLEIRSIHVDVVVVVGVVVGGSN